MQGPQAGFASSHFSFLILHVELELISWDPGYGWAHGATTSQSETFPYFEMSDRGLFATRSDRQVLEVPLPALWPETKLDSCLCDAGFGARSGGQLVVVVAKGKEGEALTENLADEEATLWYGIPWLSHWPRQINSQALKIGQNYEVESAKRILYIERATGKV